MGEHAEHGGLGLAPVPSEGPDPALLQEIQRESSGYTLDVLKNQLRPRDAVETTPGGDEYVVSDTVAPNSPCRVPNPDVVSECGLSELPSSIHSDDKTEHDAFFVQTCVEEVENTECTAPQKPLTLHEEEGALGRGVGPPIQAERVRGLQEGMDGENAMLRQGYLPLMAVEARAYGRYLPTEEGR